MKNKAPVFIDRAPVVDLRNRVAGMTDAALDTLHTNAARLMQSGSERQRASANALMPAIETELSERHSKALAASPRSRRDAEKRVERFNASLAEVKATAVATLPERPPSGPAHKFSIGQSVKLFRTLHGAMIDGLIYEVVRQLPVEQTEYQYRIRTKDGRVERVVVESQLGNPS